MSASRQALRGPAPPASTTAPWRATLPGLLRRHALRAACLGALLLIFALQAASLWRAAPAWLPAVITLRLAPGESMELSGQELAAPQAGSTRLALRRDVSAGWMLRRLGGGAPILLQQAGGEFSLGSAQLRAGQAFQVGAHLFRVDAASDGELRFSADRQQWRYDGAVLYRDGAAQDNCPDAPLALRVQTWWNRAAPAALSMPRALVLGGNLRCGNRLGLTGLAPGAALVARSHGQLRLSAGAPDGQPETVIVHDGASRTELRTREVALAGVSAITLAHTRLLLAGEAGQLTLQATRRVALFSAAQAAGPAGLERQWQPRTLWNNGHSAVVWCGAALCAAALLAAALAGVSEPGRRWRTPLELLSAASLLASAVLALLLQRAGQPPAAACSLLLAGLALLCWLSWPGRLPLALAAAAVLLAIGLLAQLEQGLGAPDSAALRFYQKSAALLAIGSGAAMLWRLCLAAPLARLAQSRVEWLLAGLAAIALAGLAAQVLWGDETGVFDLQPVELAKLALTALSAHCLALQLGWYRNMNAPRAPALAAQGRRWLQLLAPALLFLALLALALMEVDDYSPLILLLVWSAAMALAYALASDRRALAGTLLTGGVAAVAAIAWLRLTGSAELIRWGFYADRFLVWLDPASHPHTGQQLLLGARAIAEGGWWGSDQWLGLASLGQPAGAVLQVPAVQDDFAPSFFLNRHGLAAALLLWCLQAALLTGLAQLAARCRQQARQARNFRLASRARFHYFVLCGGAAFVAGHLLLSWGTNLAIFPIMGQPMSFLSAGGSHLLFFLLPLLGFAAISAQSLEEKASCQSMSNMKY